MRYYYAYKVVHSFDRIVGCDHIGLFSTVEKAQALAEKVTGQKLEWQAFANELVSFKYNVTQTGITYSNIIIYVTTLDPDY